MTVKIDVEPEDEEHIKCWCGATGTYDELFAPLPSRCGGSGMLYCECGGDLCVCHNHGEQDCFGCQDCEGDDEEYDDSYMEGPR